MRTGTKPALYLLAALVAAQLAGVEGCDISLPDIITPKAEALDVVILRETAPSTPELGSLITQLRNAEIGTNHRLYIVDDDPTKLTDYFSPVPLELPAMPSLFIVDAKNGALLASRSLAANESVASIVATMKEHSP
jgi:hypothetical protein